jgi:hypothetical protein
MYHAFGRNVNKIYVKNPEGKKTQRHGRNIKMDVYTRVWNGYYWLNAMYVVSSSVS